VKNFKYIIIVNLILAVSTLIASPENNIVYNNPNDGLLHGYFRIHHILSGKKNKNFDISGSTLGFGFKYGLKINNNLTAGVEYYGVTDTGLTKKDRYVAYAQFMNKEEDPYKLDYGDVNGFYISFKNDTINSILARSQFNSPLTKARISQVPNMYEYFNTSSKTIFGKLSLGYITKIAYGSRSVGDFALIGEKTGTGGMMINPFYNNNKYIIRGKYTKIEDTLSTNASTNGILVLGLNKKSEALSFKLWNYYISDIANNLYTEVDYKIGKTILSAQYWKQNIYLNTLESKYGGNIYAIQVKTRINKTTLKLAYSTKDNNGGLLNAWGADPVYTSSIY
jgi:hypothetical protein